MTAQELRIIIGKAKTIYLHVSFSAMQIKSIGIMHDMSIIISKDEAYTICAMADIRNVNNSEYTHIVFPAARYDAKNKTLYLN